jgi:hypothetical protein
MVGDAANMAADYCMMWLWQLAMLEGGKSA